MCDRAQNNEQKKEETFRVPFGVVPERDEPPVDTPPEQDKREFRMPFGVVPERPNEE